MQAQVWSPIDIKNVKAGGEFGRRIGKSIENNILQVDIPKSFLEKFQNRVDGGYLALGKFIEAMVWLAYQTGHQGLIKTKDETIAALLATQDADGYIGIVREKSQRIRALWDLHERSYLILALTADYNHFGKKESLAAAKKLADHIMADFGKDPDLRPNQSDGTPSDERVDYRIKFIPFTASNLGFDFALLELTKASGDNRYRDFVVNFLKLKEFNPKIECGPSSLANHSYSHLGHCLAQLNLYLTNKEDVLLEATKNTLKFMLEDDGMLITGTCSEGECWHQTQSGLQNTAETCGGFYGIQVLDAMLRIEGQSLYGDVMERAIYNAMFAAVSPDGRWARYHTPFDGKREYDMNNKDTFCCPNNLRRFMSRLTSWIYYSTPDGVAVNLYNSSTAKIPLPGGATVELIQETDYPTSGRVRIQVDPSTEGEFTLRLRIPRWCKGGTVQINGAEAVPAPGGDFYAIRRKWKNGDVVALDLPMPWRFVRGRKVQMGRAAVMRGPTIYTLNPGRNPHLSSHPQFEARQIMVDTARPVESVPDEAQRPGSVAAVVKTWGPGPHNFWPHLKRVDTTLTEFPDPAGEGIYLVVPDLKAEQLVDDELMSG